MDRPNAFAPLHVAVVGLWHLGSVSAACLASLGHIVIGMDEDSNRLAKLSMGNAPVYEPGLDELLAAQIASGRLTFTADLEDAVGRSDVVVVAHDTGVTEMDEVDMGLIQKSVERIISSLRDGSALLLFSQVPVGTCRAIQDRIRKVRQGLRAGVAYIPENLRLGQAIERFLQPDMVVIGAEDRLTGQLAEQLLASIDAPRVRTNLATAEMVKHAINAFLATCISFANELAALSEISGADASQVTAALRMDRRVGPSAPLSPGTGFSGATLARDVMALRRLGERAGIQPLILNAVVAVNDRQRLVPFMWLKEIFGQLTGLRIGVLGLTYKPGTSTVRRSASLELIHRLVREGAEVGASDPEADLAEVDDLPAFRFSRDPYSVAEGRDALLIMTAWPEFGNLDYGRIRTTMRRPVLLDLPNLLDPQSLSDLGFLYVGVGRRKSPLSITGVPATQSNT
jgi:UDPglucose 6-dehydrogenase